MSFLLREWWGILLLGILPFPWLSHAVPVVQVFLEAPASGYKGTFLRFATVFNSTSMGQSLLEYSCNVSVTVSPGAPSVVVVDLNAGRFSRCSTFARSAKTMRFLTRVVLLFFRSTAVRSGPSRRGGQHADRGLGRLVWVSPFD